MTVPRRVLPHTVYLVTRRCSQRQFLLRPSRLTNEIFLYVLSVAARRFGIAIHAFCVLSNHFHLVVSDPDARLPAFEQYLDSLVARAVNSCLGRWEAFWASGSYSAVALTSADDIIDKIAYVLANPVAAGLVSSGCEWPGLWSRPDQIGAGSMAVRRPGTFFRAKGYMPDTVDLNVTVPPGFESSAAFRERLDPAIAAVEASARREVAAQGRGFLGAAKVLAQKWWARPRPGEPRRQLSPRIAARDKWKRIEALSRLMEFVDAYREAWSARRAGKRDVRFPAGTYALRVFHDVACEAPA